MDAEPLATKIVRFERAIPQYCVGHLDHVARIDEALAALPRLHLAGAAYRGVGVAACIRDGTAVAQRVVALLRSPTPSAAEQVA